MGTIVFNTITVHGRTHVVCTTKSRGVGMTDADYRETGMALCGIIEKGENLKQWMKRCGKG